MTQGRFPFLAVNEYNITNWRPFDSEVRLLSVQASCSQNNVFLQIWAHVDPVLPGEPCAFSAPVDKKYGLLYVAFDEPGLVYDNGVTITLSSDANEYAPVTLGGNRHFHVAITGHTASGAFTGDGRLIS